jgi:aminoglycoside phosphotransferase (APT) family kinase protein
MRPRDLDDTRRNDWRFLLPVVPTRLGAITEGGLGQLLPQHASTAPPDPPYDVVVGVDPLREQLQAAHQSLRPGGVCYFEFRTWPRPSCKSLERHLRAVGFDSVRLYWSWPPYNPSIWVPLDAPTTLRWVLRRRRRRRLVYMAWLLLRACGLSRPHCATAMRPPVAEAAGPLGVDLSDLAGRPVWALLTPGRDPLNKVLAFVGTRESNDPAVVLKMPRTEASVSALEKEAHSLRALEANGARPPGVPALLFSYRDAGGLRAIAESPLGGRPLFQMLDSRSYRRFAERASEWLLQLSRSTPQAKDRRETSAEIAADATASLAPAETELLSRAAQLAAVCDPLPVVFEQRDFSPWNVHVSRDGSLVIYDWESAEPAGFPVLDLVYFLAYCGFFIDHALAPGRARDSYRTRFADGVGAECLVRYCAALGIERDRLPGLRTLTWLIHLRSSLRLSRPPATALFLELLREEVSHGAGDRAAA